MSSLARVSRVVPVVAGASFVASLACEKPVDVSSVSLDVLELNSGLSGFVCRADADTYLTERAVASQRVAFIVDFIALGGQPKCDTDSLSTWCESHACTVVGRSCFDAAVASGSATETSNQAIAKAYASIRGEKLTAAVPSEPVLVRLVATTETCSTLMAKTAAPFECAKLVGCASSCPVLLEGLDAAVDVNLDMGKGYVGDSVYESICGVGVEMCAMVPFGELSGSGCPELAGFPKAPDAGFPKVPDGLPGRD